MGGVVDSDSARQRDLETLESGNGKTRESTGVDSNSTRQSSWNYPQACTENSEASVANKKATLEAFRLYSGRGDIKKHAKTTAASGTLLVIMIKEGSTWSWYGSAGVEYIQQKPKHHWVWELKAGVLTKGRFDKLGQSI